MAWRSKDKVTSNTNKLEIDPITDGAYHIRDVLTNQLNDWDVQGFSVRSSVIVP